MPATIRFMLGAMTLAAACLSLSSCVVPDRSEPKPTLIRSYGTSIDRADWHYGGDFPPNLPEEAGGTHIGMYLAWIIHAGLGSEELLEHAGAEYNRLQRREITGRDLLFAQFDGKFFPALLSADGMQFTKAYYESDVYFEDYATTLGDSIDSIYHVEDTWANYDKLAPTLDERLTAWRARPQ